MRVKVSAKRERDATRARLEYEALSNLYRSRKYDSPLVGLSRAHRPASDQRESLDAQISVTSFCCRETLS